MSCYENLLLEEASTEPPENLRGVPVDGNSELVAREKKKCT